MLEHLLTGICGEAELTYVRSSGPGGQNVNKVNSKAVLRWNLLASSCLFGDLRARIVERLGPRLTLGGDLIIASDRFRDQGRNREDCFEKLRQILRDASHRPKARKKTKPSRSSARRLEQSKRQHSDKKSMRRKPTF